MDEAGKCIWPNHDCRPVLATLKLPAELVRGFDASVFRDRDDLDWFDAAVVDVEKVGPVLLQHYENMPDHSTVFYIDRDASILECQLVLIAAFGLRPDELSWRLDPGCCSSVPQAESGCHEQTVTSQAGGGPR